MKKPVLCLLVLFLISSPVYADFYSSNFNSGTDGWVLYTTTTGPFIPTWNSSGYITAPTQFNTPNGDGTNTTTTYVFENTTWTNFSSLYGGTIEFDVLAVSIPNFTVPPAFRDSTLAQVVLDVPGQAGLRSIDGKLIMENLGDPMNPTWFHCAISILDENFDQGPPTSSTYPYGSVSQNINNNITGLVITANFLNVLETVSIDNVRVNPVPEPATLLLLGSGLIGLAGYGRKKFRK